MLTKQDLNLIRDAIKDELLPVNANLGLVQKRLVKVEDNLGLVQKRLVKVEDKIDFVIDHFDKNQIQIVENIRNIQDNLNLPVMNFV
jgi:hypothetical protein